MTMFIPVAPSEQKAGLLDMPPWFVEPGGTIDQLGLAGRLWKSLPPNLTARQLETLRGTVFVLLKPDCLASGHGQSIFDRLRAQGGRLLHVGTTDGAGEGAFELLYELNLTSGNETNMVGAWWLNRRIYDIGPSVIALVYFAPSRRGDAGTHDIVRQLKGPACLSRTVRGQVRHDLAHAAPGLNLMHSSDDPLSTVREFLLFQTFDALTAALARIPNPESPHDLDGSAEFDAIESLGYAREDLDFVRTMVRLKLRTLTLVTDGQRSARMHESLRRYRALLRHNGDFATRWSTYRRLCEKDRTAANGADDSHAMLLKLFDYPENYSHDTARRLWAQLDYLRVSASAWEKLVVDTSMHYSAQFPG